MKLFPLLTCLYLCTFLSYILKIFGFPMQNAYIEVTMKTPHAQGGVEDDIKYVETKYERMIGASCVQNCMVWKHQTTRHKNLVNAQKSVENLVKAQISVEIVVNARQS